MTRQRRVTTVGSVALAILLAGILFLAGGNRAPGNAAAPSGGAEVIETSAQGTAVPPSSVGHAGETPASTVASSQPEIPSTTAISGFVFDFPDDTDFSSVEPATAPSTVPLTTVAPVASSSSSTTTSTIPAPVIDDGFNRSVFLKEGWAAFGTDTADAVLVQVGDDGATALAAAIDTLGEPSSDSGLVDDDDCSGLRTRRVRFGGLELVLAERVQDVVTFEQWFIDGDVSGEVPLEIDDGLSASMAVADLLAVDVLMVVFQEDDGSGSFKMPGDTSNSPVWGRTTGADSSDTVTAIWSGNECRRL